MADGSVMRETGAAGTGRLDTLAAVRQQRKLRLRFGLLVLGPLVLAVGAAYVYLTGGRYVSTDDAYIRSDIVQIASDVSGTVLSVPVTDNQKVVAGQVLFRLDDKPFQYALADAQAQLATARNDIDSLKASYQEKQSELKLAQVNAQFAQRDWKRRNELFGQHVIAQSQMDMAQQTLDGANQQLNTVRQKLAGILADLAGNPDIPIDKHPRVMAAQARLDQAQRNLDHSTVRAPAAGIVTNVPSVQPGMYLMAATPAFSLVAADHVWVEANPKETQLTWVKTGNPATISVDTYPGVQWDGKVASLSPATGAQFSLLPAQNTSGNWVKVVQRIPVRVLVETDPNKPDLRAGMSVEVEIDTGHRRSILGLFGLGHG